ncbi:hypothetical protein OSB04_009097 [Centaurea solstitialis]|uniref:C2H2-type domain-containing protein n=1 Tax=Centaurea solstitialis TaxID=347529 RepID=A0AA38U6C3_9ASTR|nr:hypothetical protein OSB04_009097 [Centaurea solstitialis]
MSNFVQDHFEEEEEENEDHFSSSTTTTRVVLLQPSPPPDENDHPTKKKRNLPGNPDPDAEVVALSPRTLMATNRYICEVCHKGFQRDQNLQLHRRGHNLPWKLKQRPANIQVKKRVYVCPDPNCVHHEPTRALGDLTGIKKHFCRKHGEKKWKCDKCSKRYAVQSDWKAHAKICGTREYRCDCGTIFSRKDSFVTHRAFCDALTEENYKMNQKVVGGVLQESCTNIMPISNHDTKSPSLNMLNDHPILFDQRTIFSSSDNSPIAPAAAAYTSATALLQKAAEMGAKVSSHDNTITPILLRGFTGYSTTTFNSSTINAVAIAMDSNTRLQHPELFDKTMEEIGRNTTTYGSSTIQSGLYDSSLLMHSSSKERQVFVGGGGERTTVDFLGVEPDNLCGKRDYHQLMSLPYDNHQQHSHW